MAAINFAEINSFIGKFTSLWQKGHDASLYMETQAGKAFVVLRLGLGENPQQNTFRPQQRVSPSRLRRREKRAAARRESAEKAETLSNAASGTDCNRNVGEVSAHADVIIENNATEEVAENSSDTKVKSEVLDSDEESKEFDQYVFSYWNNKKKSDGREASHFIAVNLKKNFIKNGVCKADQALKICNVRALEDNEVELTVLMKKNHWPVELSARECQTTEDVPVSITLKKICR